MTIKNKKFIGKIKNIYIQKNYLIIKLSNLENKSLNFNDFNYSIEANNDEIKIKLELKSVFLKNNENIKLFKFSKYKNKIFKDSSIFKENYILICKNNILIKENLLLLSTLL